RTQRGASVVVLTARINWLCAGRCDRTTGAGVSGRAGTVNLQGGSQICSMDRTARISIQHGALYHRGRGSRARTFYSAHVAARRPARTGEGLARDRGNAVAVARLRFHFRNYLADFANGYVTYYAGLASAMIALVYLYYSAWIFVFGGELNAVLARYRE